MKFLIEMLDGRQYTTVDYLDARHLHENTTVHGEFIACENDVLVNIQCVKIIQPCNEMGDLLDNLQQMKEMGWID